MIKRLIYIFILSIVFSQNGKLAVGILDFTGEDVESKILKACFQRLETSLIDSDQFIVIEKSQSDEILKEQKIQSSGICDDECVVEIGMLLGADHLMLGHIINLTDIYQIDIKIINVEKGNVTNKVTKVIEGNKIDLLRGIESASNEIIQRIASFEPKDLQYLNNEGDENQDVEFGTITINSDPTNSVVLIDNKNIGQTPIVNWKIKTGIRDVKIIHKGYVTINKGVKIEQDINSELNEVLIKKTGGVNIISQPMKSKVYIDGNYIGISPVLVSPIIIGNHQLKISHEDYFTLTKPFIVEYDKINDINIKLEPKLGSVNIISNVVGANIQINNKKYKSDPSGLTLIKLKPDDYMIKISKSGYNTEQRRIKIFANKTESLEIDIYLKDKNDIKNNYNEKYSKSYSWLFNLAILYSSYLIILGLLPPV